MAHADPLQRFGREFPRGTVLFREGDPGREMYVVQSGRVTITKRAGEVDKILTSLGQGEFFGEMALLSSRPRTATATVAEDARLLVVDSRTFETMVRENGEIALRLVKKLAERLEEADGHISNLLLRDATTRVVHFLALQAERAARGPGPVRLPVSSEALPALVGLSAQQVDEALAALVRARIVSFEPGAIVVADVSKLGHFFEFLLMRPGGSAP
jgi:CRP/FNR family transcriptional regulator, cyclic AMP receptor protein